MRQNHRGAVSEPRDDILMNEWQGTLVSDEDGRSYPEARTRVTRSSELPAGMRTQPVVTRRQLFANFIASRVHIPYAMTYASAPPPVISSRHQPILLYRAGWIDPTNSVGGFTGAGDWNWPPYYGGAWSRAGALVLPTPGGATQPPRPRFTRVTSAPRYSVLPQVY